MTPEQWAAQLLRDSRLCWDGCYYSRIDGDILLVA